ncbi:MAG: pentapeptide repeat-containing protein [Aliarcobacter sp.]|nr:pentapeptide repeat-containing protein [Aliarcobacter sp.]
MNMSKYKSKLINYLKEKCFENSYKLDSFNLDESSELLYKIDNNRKSYDGNILAGTDIYYKSNFCRCDFPQTLISNHIFIKSNLSHMECSEAIFQECIFIDCDFRHTNFTNCKFQGCLILNINTNYRKDSTSNLDTQEYGFDKSGLNKTIWESYNENSTIIVNTIFKSVAFRESVFSNVIFKKIINKSASFENAKIINCSFDSLNLENSSCKGLFFKNTKIDEFIISFAKVPYVIGLQNLFPKTNSFQIITTDDNFKINFDRIDSELVGIISTAISNTLEKGKIFEYLNLSYLLLHLVKNEDLFEDKNVVTQNKYLINNQNQDLYRNKDSLLSVLFEMFLDNFFNNSTIHISLSDFEITCKFMIYNEINNLKILKNLIHIFSHHIDIPDYNKDKYALCRIMLEEIASNVSIPNKFIFKIVNKDASMQSHKARQEFEIFFTTLMSISTFEIERNNDFIQFIEGSIKSKVFLGVNKIIGISLVCVLLGSELSYNQDEKKVIYNFNNEHLTKNVILLSNNIKDSLKELIKYSIEEVANFYSNKKIIEKMPNNDYQSLLENLILQKKDQLISISNYFLSNNLIIELSHANAINYLYKSQKSYGFDTLNFTGNDALLTI